MRDTPFLTSDFPFALEHDDRFLVQNRVFPLAPDLAVRIHPDPAQQHRKPTLVEDEGHIARFDFPDLRLVRRKPGRDEVRRLNQHIVRCAEEHVLFDRQLPWAAKFVRRNAQYRLEVVFKEVKVPRGRIVSHRIVQQRSEPQAFGAAARS